MNTKVIVSEYKETKSASAHLSAVPMLSPASLHDALIEFA